MPLDKSDDVVGFKLGILDPPRAPWCSATSSGSTAVTRASAPNGAPSRFSCSTASRRPTGSALDSSTRRSIPQGDFSDPFFMASVRGTFQVGVLFDIMLHQPGMLGTLTMMLSHVDKHLCIVQPMLEEQKHPGSLVYLPGNSAREELYPLANRVADHHAFDVQEVNHSHWIWGMTRSFLTAAMLGEGFELVHAETLKEMANPRWSWWGAIYERTHPKPASHWSTHLAYPGLYEGAW